MRVSLSRDHAARDYLPNRVTSLDVPDYHLSAALLVWVLLAGLLIGLGAAVYIRAIGWLSPHRITGIACLFAPLVAFGVLGVIGVIDMAHDAFFGRGGLGLPLALAVLKPAVTALCLAVGLGLAWSQVWPGDPVGAHAMIGAAAMIGCAIRAPSPGWRSCWNLPTADSGCARDNRRDGRLNRGRAIFRRLLDLLRPAANPREFDGSANDDVT